MMRVMRVRHLLLFIFVWIIITNFSIVSAAVNTAEVAQEVTYESQGKRDPFVPLMGGRAGAMVGLDGVQGIEDIQLGGIILDSEAGSLVLANGVVLKEGEVKDHIKVVEVRHDGVMFSINEIHQFKPFDAEVLEER